LTSVSHIQGFPSHSKQTVLSTRSPADVGWEPFNHPEAKTLLAERFNLQIPLSLIIIPIFKRKSTVEG